MRAVEELVCRKLEKRTPDELSPKPDPYSPVVHGVRRGQV